MSIKIIPADLLNATHTHALTTLLDHYAKGPMGGGQGLSEFVKKNLATELSKRIDTIVLLAFDGQIPVGLLNAIEGFSTFTCKPIMNIHDVVVLPEYRRQGVARRLFDAIEDHAIHKGCCKMTLEVLDGNKVAKAAYSRFGYKGYCLDPAVGHALFWEKKL